LLHSRSTTDGDLKLLSGVSKS